MKFRAKAVATVLSFWAMATFSEPIPDSADSQTPGTERRNVWIQMVEVTNDSDQEIQLDVSIGGSSPSSGKVVTDDAKPWIVTSNDFFLSAVRITIPHLAPGKNVVENGEKITWKSGISSVIKFKVPARMAVAYGLELNYVLHEGKWVADP